MKKIGRLLDDQPPDGEQRERRGHYERHPLEGAGDPLELGASVAQLDVSDGTHDRAAAATATRPVRAAVRSGTTTAAETEACLRHRDHRDPFALHRLAEDGRDGRTLPYRLADALEHRVGKCSLLVRCRHY